MYVYVQCARTNDRYKRRNVKGRGGKEREKEKVKKQREAQHCSDSHLKDSAWMLLAPFDDRKLLIGQRVRQSDTEIPLRPESMGIHTHAGVDKQSVIRKT